VRALLALVAVLTLSIFALPAQATEPDPGAHDKLVGIITADVGVVALVGGVGMLIGGALVDDMSLAHGLNLGGGLLAAAGGTAALVGTVIWFLGRKQTADAKAASKANPPATKVSLSPTSLAVHF
jgi:hypothetical protein